MNVGGRAVLRCPVMPQRFLPQGKEVWNGWDEMRAVWDERQGGVEACPDLPWIDLACLYRGDGDHGKVSAHLEAAVDSSMAAAHFSLAGCSKETDDGCSGSPSDCIRRTTPGIASGSDAVARLGGTGEDIPCMCFEWFGWRWQQWPWRGCLPCRHRGWPEWSGCYGGRRVVRTGIEMKQARLDIRG
jgi:hypothetical protein